MLKYVDLDMDSGHRGKTRLHLFLGLNKRALTNLEMGWFNFFQCSLESLTGDI